MTPDIDPQPPTSVLNPGTNPAHALSHAIVTLLTTPGEYPSERPYPSHMSRLYLIVLLALLLGGLFGAPGVTLRPLMVCLISVGVWAALVSILHIACSILGIALEWKEGSRLLSLAGLPILLKFLGAYTFAVFTSISPFLFTASPALFINHPSPWVWRLDLFEIWSAALVYILIQKRGVTRNQALRITAVVWVAAAALLTCLLRFGDGA